MSRIHEALKRAEQEREGRPLPALGSKMAELAEAGTAVPAEMPPPSAEGIAPEAPSELEEPGSDMTLEVLKSRVRRYKWNPNAKTMLFFGGEDYAPGTEEFRTLRSQLFGLNEASALRSLLVTSASPREGKSFIASNTAQILARQPDKRVLLIDGDLRWSRLHLSLGTPAVPGLADYLSGEANELSVMQRGPLENLYFIPGGKHPANPAELVSNGRFKTLLDRLSPAFDWIIVDTPPAIAVSDARVLASTCDGVLLVVWAGGISYEDVQKARDQFKGRRLLGVVLNRVDARGSSSYKYYNYYQGSVESSNGKSRRART
jgi:protein-tyrosine kinase